MGNQINFLIDPKPSFLTNLALIFKKASILLIAMVLITIAIYYGPTIWYWASGNAQTISEILARPDDGGLGTILEDAGVKQANNYQPRLDPTLGNEAKLIIPTIGIETVLNEATYENYEDALREGVWRIPHYGVPSTKSVPTILAAHRFGYLKWSNLYRRQNSFYNLPKLENGDQVEVIWRSRKYVYQIYDGSKGEDIKDYTADLILYTCQDLSSPKRVFKYARLIEV